MNDKELVAAHAAQYITDGMIVGLGTGSTANLLIQALAKRAQEGLRCRVVASSLASTLLAKELGLSLQSIEHTSRLDLYIDGADEVSPEKTLLKGRGYDLVKEKLLARASERFLVMVDGSKLVPRIGARYPIPVEVLPFAWRLVERSLRDVGGSPTLRQNAAKDAPAITSMGNLVLDTTFPQEQDTTALAQSLSAIPGVAEHGIFLDQQHTVLVAQDGQVKAL